MREVPTAGPDARESGIGARLLPGHSLACYDFMMSAYERGEQGGLATEVAFAADLTDADCVRTLRDLLRTADAIRKWQ
jgi:hypothetical protein